MTDNDLTNTVNATSAASANNATNLSSSSNATDVTDIIDQPPLSSSSTPISSSSSLLETDHVVISAIEIAGGDASDDFVKIYNPTSNVIDISNWKLRKKSSTGADSSLRELPVGSAVLPGGYFVWASSANGFAQSIHADASSTGTLASNNSVALFDENGAQIDAVAWGTGTDPYVESIPYPDNPTANQVLERKFVNGVVVDTGNNKNDFTL
jgi:hypothetical protein